jgi:hypothetical protein
MKKLVNITLKVLFGGLLTLCLLGLVAMLLMIGVMVYVQPWGTHTIFFGGIVAGYLVVWSSIRLYEWSESK